MTTIREKLLSSITRIGELDPDVRFGQLIANLATIAGGASDQSIWDLEDEQILDAMNELIDMLSSRRVDAIPEAIAG